LKDRLAGAGVDTDRAELLKQFETLAKDLAAAYHGDADALERLGDAFARSLTLEELRARVQQRLMPLPGSAEAMVDFGLAEAQLLVARLYGFGSWTKLTESISHPPGDAPFAPPGMSSTPPFYKIDSKNNTLEPRPPLSAKDWDTIFGVMTDIGLTGLNSGGQMTDAVLE